MATKKYSSTQIINAVADMARAKGYDVEVFDDDSLTASMANYEMFYVYTTYMGTEFNGYGERYVYKNGSPKQIANWISTHC